jgi:hypothetical protein
MNRFSLFVSREGRCGVEDHLFLAMGTPKGQYKIDNMHPTNIQPYKGKNSNVSLELKGICVVIYL